MAEALQHRPAPQRPWLSPAGAGKHRVHRPEAHHALTINLEHSVGAAQADDGWNRLEAVKAAVKKELKQEFAINHSTLEFEHVRNAHTNAELFGHQEADRNGKDHVHESSE
jgi:hypothetical protein